MDKVLKLARFERWTSGRPVTYLLGLRGLLCGSLRYFLAEVHRALLQTLGVAAHIEIESKVSKWSFIF